MSDFQDITSAVGRIVSGDPFRPNTMDGDKQRLKYKTGAQAGQDRNEFKIGLAVPKDKCEKMFQTMTTKAAKDFPNLFMNGQPQDFSWKFTDGDDQTPNKKNKRPCDKEGYPGHFVFWFTNDKAPKCYNYGDWANELLGTGIKCGDYVVITGSVRGNQRTDSPGIYMNLDSIAKIQDGVAISKRPSAEQMFAGVDITLPANAQIQAPTVAPGTQGPPMGQAPGGAPGMTPMGQAPGGAPGMTPMGQAPGGVPGMPPMGQAPGGVPGMPPMGQAPGGVPGMPQPPTTQPHTSILQPQVQPPAQIIKRVYQGQTFTEDELKSNGWDETLIQTLPIAQ